MECGTIMSVFVGGSKYNLNGVIELHLSDDDEKS